MLVRTLGPFYGLLLYFMDNWYILWSFWYIFLVLVFCAPKNLATLFSCKQLIRVAVLIKKTALEDPGGQRLKGPVAAAPSSVVEAVTAVVPVVVLASNCQGPYSEMCGNIILL
jgi:hypothetical protein